MGYMHRSDDGGVGVDAKRRRVKPTGATGGDRGVGSDMWTGGGAGPTTAAAYRTCRTGCPIDSRYLRALRGVTGGYYPVCRALVFDSTVLSGQLATPCGSISLVGEGSWSVRV